MHKKKNSINLSIFGDKDLILRNIMCRFLRKKSR